VGGLEGFPVFSLHGTPGSRFGRHYDEGAYVEAGARVITMTDRGMAAPTVIVAVGWWTAFRM
jgi:hypothetical protein